MGKMTAIDVSVSIANFGQRLLLEQCLRSLFETSEGLSLEVFVVDNASRDGSVDMVREEFPDVQLIVNENNRGYAAANNQAIARSRGRYVLVLNNDTVVLRNAIPSMVAFLNEHPQVGMLGPRVLNSDGTLQRSCSTFPSLWRLTSRALYIDKLLPGNPVTGTLSMSYWEYDSISEVDVISGCCMLVRKDVIRQVGLMDERFFFYAEEADWCYRAKQNGWKVCFLPEAEIIHYGGRSTEDCTGEMHTQYFRSRLQYYEKHFSQLGYLTAKLLSVFQVGSRLVYHWCLQPFLVEGARENAECKISLYWSTLRWLLGRPPRRASAR